jgi:hypothetical protein
MISDALDAFLASFERLFAATPVTARRPPVKAVG